MRECRRVKLVFGRYSSIIRLWKGEETIRLLLRFPTPSGHFIMPLARCVTSLVGNFIRDLESRHNTLGKNNFLQSNQYLSDGKIISKSMVGRFALVLWTGCKFNDSPSRYLYAKCSAVQYEGELQADKNLYLAVWMITWLPNCLSDDQVKTLERLNYLPDITRPIKCFTK